MITDWGTLGLGVWVDDLKLTDGATVLESNDFETDLGGWTVGPPPAGTDVPVNGWERRGEEFKEGGVVTTDDTVYTGFGFEGINESARGGVHEAHADAPRGAAGRRRSASRSTSGARSIRRRRRDPGRPVTAPAPTSSGGVLGQTKTKTLRASAKLKSAKTLRVSRKRAVSGPGELQR